MTDDAKCKGRDCPIRDKCLRFTRASAGMQWYAAFDETEKAGTTDCEGFDRDAEVK